MAKGLISEHDLAIAEHHASREQMDLVDAVIATGLVDEGDAYAALAAAAGTDLVSLGSRELSELAVRLVPDRIARKYLVVPLEVDDRTLTYATCRPDDAEAERDVAFASGRRTRMLVARRSDVVAAHDRW